MQQAHSNYGGAYLSKILSVKKYRSKQLYDPVEKIWHERLLEFARCSANRTFSSHFQDRMIERGIDEQDVNLLIDKGRIWAIEIGSDKVDLLKWAPKWVLCWPECDNWVLGGVFAYDGMQLIGVTVYPRKEQRTLTISHKIV